MADKLPYKRNARSLSLSGETGQADDRSGSVPEIDGMLPAEQKSDPVIPDETSMQQAVRDAYDIDEKREIEVLSHLENSRLISEYTIALETQDTELVNKIKWKIVLANIPLIYTIAWPIFKRFKCQEKGFEIDDLVSIGYEGVLRGIITFDPSKGFAFGTYAGWWIRNYIVRYVHDNDRTMRLPQYIHDKIPKIRMAEDYFITLGKLNSSDREIADRLGWDEQDVSAIRQTLRTSVTSFDNPKNKDDDFDLYNYCPDKTPDPENTLLTDSWHQTIRSLLEISPKAKGSLTSGERCILKLRFGIKSDHEKILIKVQDDSQGKFFKEIPIEYDSHEKTLEEIGIIFGVTRERIRQIELSALRKLRKLYYNQVIKDVDPGEISVEELALIKSLHYQDKGMPSRKGRKKAASSFERSDNLKTLKRFIVDKDTPVG